ncbi:MAG: hypothetical protein OJF49_001025 [Ktedonobacterales bacterium]|jgi:hypothetical protein|nr:MAG: hypothetical protein OJF49_001025 [Ktedonobacterales bacterium]
MTEQLRRAVERIAMLPEAEQNEIAARMLALLDDQRWERLLNDPKTEILLDILSADGDAEDDAGLTRPLSESYE